MLVMHRSATAKLITNTLASERSFWCTVTAPMTKILPMVPTIKRKQSANRCKVSRYASMATFGFDMDVLNVGILNVTFSMFSLSLMTENIRFASSIFRLLYESLYVV